MSIVNKTLSFIALVTGIGVMFANASCVSAQKKVSAGEQERYKLAADYSKEFRGLSLLILKGGKIVHEEYQNGFQADEAHQLASGTKSFAGVMALMAVEDKLLKLDEKASDTITEWKTDKRKSQITIRQLLTLTSGIDAGEIGAPPTYSEAVKSPAKFDAGTTFEYGPVPFQIFGEILRRKLAPKKEGVMDYMKRKLFDPIGLKVSSWTMQNGQPNIPSGARLTAREWAKFGQFLKNGGTWNGKKLVDKKLLDECFVGSKANPNYGLTFWLNRAHDGSANVPERTSGRMSGLMDRLGIEPETARLSKNGISADLPKDLFLAAGAGKQRLYIIPSLDLIIVRQGRQSRFDDVEFLKRLLSDKVRK
jgi:CubicO group peptidase (beta-lactamase class C family)